MKPGDGQMSELRRTSPARAGGLAAALLLAGCGLLPGEGAVEGVFGPGTGLDRLEALPPLPEDPLPAPSPPTATAMDGPVEPRGEVEFYRPGSGRFVRAAPAPPPPPGAGDVTLNFENTNLREVVKVVLGDLLGENYLVDPQVQGTVTLQTSQPLAREALLATLEMLLRMNGAAVVRRDGALHVVPRELALAGPVLPQLGDASAPLPPGYGLRVVPLRHVAVQEMQGILESLAPPGSVVRADSARNLLVLAGTRQELSGLLEVVEIFDVDWLAGMSVALFTPAYVDPATLAGDLEQVFGEAGGGPLAGAVRLVPIERLGGLLVLTPRAEMLDHVATWVRRLDRDTGAAGQRLFVYHVQNGKATDLAEVLNQVFREEEARVPPAELAPGLRPVELGAARRSLRPGMPMPLPAAAEGEVAPPQPGAPSPLPALAARRGGGQQEGLELDRGPPMRIIPDEVNNALLIMATASQYRQVESALRALDITPLQVLIEVTIAEVSLSGELTYGLEWFFKNHIGNKSGRGLLDLGEQGLAALAPGFSYTITDSAGVVRAVLNTLAAQSRLNIVSSPSLMVLNNQRASIQVGDQVPITTQQQQATVAASTLINTIEFRDTGVLLSVTPRVNAGGLVIMEVEQEVSNVSRDDGSLTPTISQRRISSTVAVQSGQTVVLGGLIRENRDRNRSGVPVLHDIPVLGVLFGRDADRSGRTELVVLITPRAVQDSREARRITEEFRVKMKSLRPIRETEPRWTPQTGSESAQPGTPEASRPKTVREAAPATTAPLPPT